MLLSCCFVAFAVNAQNAPNANNLSSSDLQQPTQKKKFVVAVGQDSYPYQFGVDGAKADGLLVDIWNRWASRNGYVLEFKVAPWIDTLRMLEQGEVDFHAGMAFTEARDKKYRLGTRVLPIHAAIFVHQQLNGITALEDLQPYVVGVVSDTSHIPTIRAQVPGIQFKTFDSRIDLFNAAGRGELKAFAGLSRGMSTHRDFAQLAKQFPLYKKITYFQYDMTFAVAKSNDKLWQRITDGLTKLSSDDYAELERKWLGLGTQTDALLVSTQTDMAPFMSVSADGEPIGLFIDIWRKWSEKTGQKIAFMAENRVLSLQNLNNKSADIHAAYADAAINANSYPHAHHLYSYDSVVYFPVDDTAQELTKESMSKAVMGVLSNDPVINPLMRRFPEVDLIRYSNKEAMVDAALSGNIEGFIGGREVINTHLVKLNQQAKFAVLENVRIETKLYSLVRRDNMALISQIKEGFEIINLDELREMEKRWIQTPESRYFANLRTKINFTAAEKSWLLRHPVIRLGAVRNWAPIEFTNDKGEFVGVTRDLMDIFEKRAQISIEVQLFDEWADVLEALKAGDIDMVASMEQNQARQSFAVFTDGYWPQHWGVILPGETLNVHSLAQLSGKRLAVVKGYQLIPHIHQHFPKILMQIVPDNESGFKAVRNGQADAFIDGMVALATELREGRHRDLSFSLVDDVEPALERMGIRKDYQPLATILNKVIHTITDDEKKQILEKWFELKIESGIETEKVLQIGFLVVLIFLFILIWNRRLRSEVNLRKAIEQKMKHMATHDELTQLPNRVLLRDRLNIAIPSHARHHEFLALLFIDLDGFKDINDTYGHDVGDELLVQLGERFRTTVRRSDTVARFGGDEFVVLLTQLHQNDEAAEVAEKLLQIIGQPFALSRCTVEVGASIGIAIYPEDGVNDTELMKVADTLMYKVKAAGKNHYLFNEVDESAA